MRMEPTTNPRSAEPAEFRAIATRLERLALQLPIDARRHAEQTVRLLRAHADREAGCRVHQCRSLASPSSMIGLRGPAR